MCRNCYNTTAASFSSSLAITNPELIWAHHQEQKQRAASSCKAQRPQPQAEPQSHVKPSSASTYSESTTYSYDKDKEQSQTEAAKQKRSMRQRLKDAFKDVGSQSTSKDDRDTKDQKPNHATTSSSPLSRK